MSFWLALIQQEVGQSSFGPTCRPVTVLTKKRWFVDYEACRKPPKKSVSPTRERIERVVASLGPFRCLETNIYGVPTRKATALASTDRISKPFEFLIANLKPTVILVHGKYVTILLQLLMRIPSLPKDRFVKLSTSLGSTWFCSVSHLSRVSYRDASQLGVKARQILSSSKNSNTADRFLTNVIQRRKRPRV
jgi:hypothetical protein